MKNRFILHGKECAERGGDIVNTQSSGASEFWLYKWIRENQIRSVHDAARLLSSTMELGKMKDLASEWWLESKRTFDTETSLFAASGLDLFGPLTCPGIKCRKKQIDVLFRHAWHYFDIIQLPDSVGYQLMHSDWKTDRKGFVESLLGGIAVVLYLMGIGATELITFVERHPISEKEAESFMNSLGYSSDTGISKDLVDHFLQIATFRSLKVRGNKFKYDIYDPDVALATSRVFKIEPPDGKLNEEVRKRTVAQDMIYLHLLVLANDLHAQLESGGTFGSTTWSHGMVLSAKMKPADPDSVAFNLNLPGISGIPVSDLIRIRIDEEESFRRFRAALRKAFAEKSAGKILSDQSKITKEVYGDLIQPELDLISSKLASRLSILAKKTATTVSLSVLAATCGLIIGAPAAVIGMAAIGGLVAGTSKATSQYIDGEKEIKLSDMYFLWKAIGHASH